MVTPSSSIRTDEFLQNRRDMPVQILADAIARLDLVTQLVQRDRLGDALSFEVGLIPLTEAIFIARTIASMPTDRIAGSDMYSALHARVADLYEQLVRVITFDPLVATARPNEDRNAIILSVRQAATVLLDTFAPLAGYLMLIGGGVGDAPKAEAAFTRQTERLNAIITAAELDQERAAAAAEATEEAAISTVRLATEARQAADAASASAARSGVVRYAGAFQTQAGRHRENASGWFWRAVIAMIVLLIIAGILLYVMPVEGSISDAKMIQTILVKALAISFGSYVAIFCLRMFRAESHLCVVNEHRERALLTFQAFVEGTSDSGTKDAVLLEATRAIFAPGVTGMLDGHESSNQPTTLLEIFRGLSTGRSPTG